MKAAGIAAIKDELKNLTVKEISELCLRLARYKKDNKELLAYLLFDAQDTDAYTRLIKEDIDEAFKEVNRSNLHLAKKTLRKILRRINKYVSFTLSKQTEIELRLYFCKGLQASGIAFRKNKALVNMYAQQIKKIRAALAGLHEDIQYDYIKPLEQLQENF
jgi:hypothetical protein